MVNCHGRSHTVYGQQSWKKPHSVWSAVMEEATQCVVSSHGRSHTVSGQQSWKKPHSVWSAVMEEATQCVVSSHGRSHTVYGQQSWKKPHSAEKYDAGTSLCCIIFSFCVHRLPTSFGLGVPLLCMFREVDLNFRNRRSAHTHAHMHTHRQMF